MYQSGHMLQFIYQIATRQKYHENVQLLKLNNMFIMMFTLYSILIRPIEFVVHFSMTLYYIYIYNDSSEMPNVE